MTDAAEPTRPVRVAVVNDFPVVVMGLSAMVAQHRDRVEVVDLADEPDARPDIVLKETFGSLLDDLANAAELGDRVVAFSAADDMRAVKAALERGASGYVHKSASVEELIEAIERVHAGEQVVLRRSGSGRRGTVGTVDWPGRAQGLSDREAEVLVLICRGMSNQEVAESLYLSVNSVKTYIRTLYRKIGAQSRSQAVIWGLQHGFAAEETSSRG